MDRDNNIIQWLLSFDNPSLTFRTYTELLDYNPDSPEVIKVKNKIAFSHDVGKIMEAMHPDGYWLQKQYDGKIVGDDVEYGSFATTHFCLSYLAELGMTREHPFIYKAAERYLNLQKKDGDWWQHLSCLTGYNISTFIKLGYKNDSRIQKSIDLMLKTNRFDSGYLCDIHEKNEKSKKKKSCIRGAAKVLSAFSLLPEYWEHARCKELVNYFLNRGGFYKSGKNTVLVNKDINTLTFPVIWRTNSWEILLALSKMGYGKDLRLENAWKFLDSLKNKNNRYNLDYTPPQALWKVGVRGSENPWITFYVFLTKKYRENKI